MSDLINIAILGASGFVGGELINLCSKHQHINIKALSANSLAGQDVKIKNKNTHNLKYQLIEDIDFKDKTFVVDCNIDIDKAVQFANLASGVVVGKIGSAVATLDEIIEYESSSQIGCCLEISEKKKIRRLIYLFPLIYLRSYPIT
mgnify:CR=1 FL=1